MAVVDSLKGAGLLNDIERIVWAELRPKLANIVYQAIDDNPDEVIFSFKHSYLHIPISITMRAYQLRPVVGWILGADTRSAPTSAEGNE